MKAFLLGFFSKILKDMLILFAVTYIGEWIADKWGLSRFQRAWWISLVIIFVLVVFLWSSFGRILLW